MLSLGRFGPFGAQKMARDGSTVAIVGRPIAVGVTTGVIQRRSRVGSAGLGMRKGIVSAVVGWLDSSTTRYQLQEK